MSFSPADFITSAQSVAAVGADFGRIDSMDDDSLLLLGDVISAHQRQFDLFRAAFAGEVARRSRRDLGYAGLAQQRGFRTPEALLQSLNGVSRGEAGKLVKLGAMMAEAEAEAEAELAAARAGAGDGGADDGLGGLGGGLGGSGGAGDGTDGGPGGGFGDEPGIGSPTDFGAGAGAGAAFGSGWKLGLARALQRGEISTDGADAIRRGLGDPDQAVTGAQLAQAIAEMLEDLAAAGGRLSPEQLYVRARELREDADEDAVARRLKEQRDQRYLKIHRRMDGMYRIDGLLDPVDGREVAAIIDAMVSPRRGGPRFTDPGDRARAKALVDDSRSTDQIVADGFVSLMRIAVESDPRIVLGKGRPAVRVIVTESNLAQRSGRGRIEGTTDTVTLDEIDRFRCDAGVIGIKFDDNGQCLDMGREKRLFTSAQRIALSIRDGGCRWPGCDRPPSWAEAHHIDHWVRDHGKTDVADGLLLCRYHHMLLHNNRWQVRREGSAYWLIPPAAVDSRRVPVAMPSHAPEILALSG